MIPNCEVCLAYAEGPFEDQEGIGAHFESKALDPGPNKGTKQVAAIRVDLHVSVIKLARHAVLHKPRLIFGKGQGGVVAAAYGHPGCFEAVLASRNVQLAELPELSQEGAT